MTVYSVFANPQATEPVPLVVPQRFSWLAALLPPVFMLVHRTWLALVLYAIGVVGLWYGGSFVGAQAVVWLYVLLALWLGFAASGLRAMALRHRGYHHATEIVAAGEDLAQMQALNLGILAK